MGFASLCAGHDVPQIFSFVRSDQGTPLLMSVASHAKTADEVWQWLDKKQKYEENFNKLAWADHRFDALICPVQATPALQHGQTKLLSPLA